MSAIDDITDHIVKVASGGDPEQELRAKLTLHAYECMFGMMSRAWTGWPEENQKDKSKDAGSGLDFFPRLLEKHVGKAINDELRKGIDHLYKSVI